MMSCRRCGIGLLWGLPVCCIDIHNCSSKFIGVVIGHAARAAICGGQVCLRLQCFTPHIHYAYGVAVSMSVSLATPYQYQLYERSSVSISFLHYSWRCSQRFIAWTMEPRPNVPMWKLRSLRHELSLPHELATISPGVAAITTNIRTWR